MSAQSTKLGFSVQAVTPFVVLGQMIFDIEFLHHFANKGPSSQSSGFSSGCIQI